MSTVNTALDWRRSTRCDTSACVEVAITGQGVALRDSKDPHSPILRFSRQEWEAFVAGVNNGEFSLS